MTRPVAVLGASSGRLSVKAYGNGLLVFLYRNGTQPTLFSVVNPWA